MCCIGVWQWVLGDILRLPISSGPASNPPARSDYKQVNSSLYQLYPKPEADLYAPEEPGVDVIFFHGLQAWDYVDAFWKTWKSQTQKDDAAEKEVICWPVEWLGPDLKNARIFSVSYDSSIMRNTQGVQDLLTIGENLVEDIILSSSNIGQNRPVILVGHSLGGITIKRFLLSALEKDDAKIFSFLTNLKGIFYYSTPHHGSELANLAESVPGSWVSPVLKFLQVLNKDTARLNNKFEKWRTKAEVRTFTVGEALPTEKMGVPFGIVVPEGSARFDTDGHYTAQANHFKVCKPSSKDADTYQLLLDFIKERVEEADRNRSEFSSREGAALTVIDKNR